MTPAAPGPNTLEGSNPPAGPAGPAARSDGRRYFECIARDGSSPYHSAVFRGRHPYFYVAVAVLLFLPAFAAPSSSRGGSRTWEEKLDPFLRRVALGVERRQGLLVDRLPARSRAALDALPPFVQADRNAADPILYVKARLDDGELADAAGTAAGASGPADDATTGPGRSAGARRRVSAGLAARLDALGVEVRGRAGAIVSLRVPASALEDLAAIDEVRWLQTSRGYSLQNDVGTSDAHTAARTENTTFGNAGEGVIVAVIDSGIDWTSDDFRNPDGTTRLLGIWDQTVATGAYPPPPGFGFGSYYSRADIDAALSGGPSLPTQDGYGHGTHVTGSAAGNGRATGNGIPPGTFAGMAPAADLLVVRVFGNSGEFCPACDLVAAVEFIDGVASAAGKPWVGNMSLGSSLGGAHDGTSPDEIAIDAIVRPGRRPAAQMAIAAGNYGSSNRRFHWQGNLPAVGNSATTTFTLNSLTPNAGSNTDFIWLDVWYRGSDNATVTIQTPGAQTVSATRGADSGLVCTTSGAVHVDATNAGDPENGDNQVFVTIFDSSACAPVVEPATGLWTVRLTTAGLGGPTGGPFDLWNAAETPRTLVGFGGGWAQLSAFNLAKSVSIPGTARNALTAGAYVSKTSWINGDGGTTTPGSNPLGALSDFSGVGPTRDGRTKPDFAAPGQYVGSTKSRNISAAGAQMERDQVHLGQYSGTSMATPHLAGAAALVVGLHPDFDAAEVRLVLQRGARGDLQTGGLPNNKFGWGKLRVLEAAYDAAAMAASLGAGPDGQSFDWPGSPSVLSWNVYRGALPGIAANNYGTCFQSGLSSPHFSDPDLPAAGAGFFYFVTGVYLNPTSGLPVEGSLGTDSSGRPRPNSAACP